MLFPFVILNGEPWRLQELIQSSEWTGNVFMWGCVVTGVFGFLLCVAGLLSIKVTSPITHMFSSVSSAGHPDIAIQMSSDMSAGCSFGATNDPGSLDLQ